jgi:glutamate dehydrogenase (NADP+)
MHSGFQGQPQDAATLIRNGVICVAEGTRMPCTAEAVKAFESAGVLYAPGKVSNAGGVARSGLEMSQNAIRLAWPADEVDQRLRRIMLGMRDACVGHGGLPDGRASYVDGANIAGFALVAMAMMTLPAIRANRCRRRGVWRPSVVLHGNK